MMDSLLIGGNNYGEQVGGNFYRCSGDMHIYPRQRVKDDLFWAMKLINFCPTSAILFDNKLRIIHLNNRFGTVTRYTTNIEDLSNQAKVVYKNGSEILHRSLESINKMIPCAFKLHHVTGDIIRCCITPCDRSYKKFFLIAVRDRDG